MLTWIFSFIVLHDDSVWCSIWAYSSYTWRYNAGHCDRTSVYRPGLVGLFYEVGGQQQRTFLAGRRWVFFCFLHRIDYFAVLCSFLSDCHLIVDASIVVNVQLSTKFRAASQDDKRNEQLFPDRHQVTLPINGLNSLFTSCDVAVNHHTQISADRYPRKGFLFDWLFLCG